MLTQVDILQEKFRIKWLFFAKNRRQKAREFMKKWQLFPGVACLSVITQ